MKSCSLLLCGIVVSEETFGDTVPGHLRGAELHATPKWQPPMSLMNLENTLLPLSDQMEHGGSRGG